VREQNRVFPVGAFEASLLENLLSLDTMIAEEVAKESSDIACLGARRLLYGSSAF
jgi:creatinine amidohydrolase/Fe(II)-dependent formamide hydrolase-like protein